MCRNISAVVTWSNKDVSDSFVDMRGLVGVNVVFFVYGVSPYINLSFIIFIFISSCFDIRNILLSNQTDIT